MCIVSGGDRRMGAHVPRFHLAVHAALEVQLGVLAAMVLERGVVLAVHFAVLAIMVWER